jgi:hypothetical protein
VIDRVGLRDIVGEIVGAGLPVSDELALLNNPVLDPMVTYVDCFTLADLSGAVGNSACRLIVISELGGSLRMTQVTESLTIYLGVLTIQEEGGVGGLGGGADHGRDDGACGANRAVDRVRVVRARVNDWSARRKTGTTGSREWVA